MITALVNAFIQTVKDNLNYVLELFLEIPCTSNTLRKLGEDGFIFCSYVKNGVWSCCAQVISCGKVVIMLVRGEPGLVNVFLSAD